MRAERRAISALPTVSTPPSQRPWPDRRTREELGAEVERDGDEVVGVGLPEGVQDADHVRSRVR